MPNATELNFNNRQFALQQEHIPSNSELEINNIRDFVNVTTDDVRNFQNEFLEKNKNLDNDKKNKITSIITEYSTENLKKLTNAKLSTKDVDKLNGDLKTLFDNIELSFVAEHSNVVLAIMWLALTNLTAEFNKTTENYDTAPIDDRVLKFEQIAELVNMFSVIGDSKYRKSDGIFLDIMNNVVNPIKNFANLKWRQAPTKDNGKKLNMVTDKGILKKRRFGIIGFARRKPVTATIGGLAIAIGLYCAGIPGLVAKGVEILVSFGATYAAPGIIAAGTTILNILQNVTPGVPTGGFPTIQIDLTSASNIVSVLCTAFNPSDVTTFFSALSDNLGEILKSINDKNVAASITAEFNEIFKIQQKINLINFVQAMELPSVLNNVKDVSQMFAPDASDFRDTFYTIASGTSTIKLTIENIPDWLSTMKCKVFFGVSDATQLTNIFGNNNNFFNENSTMNDVLKKLTATKSLDKFLKLQLKNAMVSIQELYKSPYSTGIDFTSMSFKSVLQFIYSNNINLMIKGLNTAINLTEMQKRSNSQAVNNIKNAVNSLPSPEQIALFRFIQDYRTQLKKVEPTRINRVYNWFFKNRLSSTEWNKYNSIQPPLYFGGKKTKRKKITQIKRNRVISKRFRRSISK